MQEHPRRLTGATSPYLRMHADDPVDWHRWGPDAFAEAARTGKPVFLSCGYAACHWCHVMQRESFRDEETARYLNRHFVCVKVDREERLDVDKTYQAYVAATTGGGGWPLTVFLSPSGAPLLGGTYFPKQAPAGRVSLRDAADAVLSAWREDPERAEEIEAQALAFLEEQTRPRATGPVTPHLVTEAAEQLMHWFDRENGGFGDAPKFPQPTLGEFLLAFAEAADDAGVLAAVEQAVQAQLRGGIYDQVGGGTFRYATDERWLVPHFEKMLYDNAMLLSSLAALYRIHPEEEYAREARRTAAFLRREMSVGGGGFGSSLSAETRGVEGATYTWTHEELAEALSAEDLALAERYLGVTEEGVLGGANVLTRREGRRDDAEAVDRLLERLAEIRASRPRPERDDKVVTSWNALAAKGLIEAGHAIGDETLVSDGLATLDFLLQRAVSDGEVVHVLDDEDVAGMRLVEDYATLVAACWTAWDLTGRDDLLEDGVRLFAAARERFYDDGLIWMTAGETALPVRPREEHDDPTPSGAALLVLDAVKLAAATGDESYRRFAEDVLPSFWGVADYSPFSAGTALTAMLHYLAGQRI